MRYRTFAAMAPVGIFRANRDMYVASHDLKAPLRAIDHRSKWVVEDAAIDYRPVHSALAKAS